MIFPPEFQFTQGNLQNFIECRRRFYYSSIRRLAWPAIASEPMLESERHMMLGNSFHRLAQQYFLGVPVESLRQQAKDEVLRAWLEAFIVSLNSLPGIRADQARFLPEISLTSQMTGFRLTAKYDLLVIQPDKSLVIYDWKTSHFRTRRKFLANRMQTRLYRYLLAQLGQRFTAQTVTPDQISMIYWFASAPDQPEVFSYSSQQYAEDAQVLSQLLQSIETLVANDTPEKAGLEFPLTADLERCAFCVYRSLCDRGLTAGIRSEQADASEFEADRGIELSEIDFNLEQITEIEF